MEKTVRGFLIFGAFYLIFDGIIHFFNLRLFSTKYIWPDSAFSYATLLNMVYASFVFLTAAFVLIFQSDLKKYKNFIVVSALWAFFHAGLLIFLSIGQNLTMKAEGLPSLYVWSPFYNQYLLGEAGLLFIYASLVLIWIKRK